MVGLVVVWQPWRVAPDPVPSMRWLISRKWPEARRSTPLFAVRDKGRQGFMDASGRIVIDAVYTKVYPFSDGLAAVADDSHRWGYINERGEIVIAPRFAMPGFFVEGLAPAREEFNSPWGYIDRGGNWVIKPRFNLAEAFAGGMALVGHQTISSRLLTSVADVEMDVRWEVIDRAGRRVDPATAVKRAALPADALLPASQGGLKGYTDRAGRFVIAPQFRSADWFAEDRAAVFLDGAWGFIETTGRVVIAPRYKYVGRFAEGVAPVQHGEKWGFIDRDGNFVIEPRFHWAHEFCNGLAEATVDGKAGYIDHEGRYVWEPQP